MLSTILVHETNMVERFVYFESKMFKYAKVRHHKIKRISLVVVVTVRNLRPYFQGHRILVKIDYLIRQDLKDPDLARRMISWTIKLYEYDIQYIHRGSIKSHVLVDFLDDFSMPIGDQVSPAWIL